MPSGIIVDGVFYPEGSVPVKKEPDLSSACGRAEADNVVKPTEEEVV